MMVSRASRGFMVLLWCAVTVCNLTKAFHIDDTFHLIAAEHILQHPTEPMSGWVNWKEHAVPMHHGAHPPLFYYLLAGVLYMFGPNEIAVHAFMSLFALLALYGFRGCLRELRVRRERHVMVLFACFPAFVAGQNVMLDVPLLSLLLISFPLFIRVANGAGLKHHFALAAVLTTAMMLKYSALPILLLYPLIAVLRRDLRGLIAMVVPVVVIAAWSCWNVHEFGAMHLLKKSERMIEPDSPWSFIACLGGLAVTTSLFFPAPRWKVLHRVLALAGPAILLIVGGLVLGDRMQEIWSNVLLTALFLLNGSMIIVFVLAHYAWTVRVGDLLSDPRTIALAFALAIATFVFIFSEFAAARHILLIYPFLLLMGARMLDEASPKIMYFAMGKGVVLGALLAISDATYAGYYRKMVSRIEVPPGRTTWTIGHWGWQWYAEQAGMKSYDVKRSQLTKGELFIRPQKADRQHIYPLAHDVSLLVRKQLWEDGDWRTFVSVKTAASLYSSSLRVPVWNFSMLPVDTIEVCEVASGWEGAIHNQIMVIRSDERWLRRVIGKAEERAVPVDSMLRWDAIYVLDQLVKAGDRSRQ